ncbi:MAG: type II toxin-antitoxin system HicB family antitoxin [Firmicutes bacterium]|nr:type II toxin-antitoxin system HicB family antitoxin [Bacillota bacterium]
MSARDKELKAMRNNSKNVRFDTMKDLNYYLKLKYPFILEKDNDGSYFIEYPDLPGCMTCGSTIEEALRMGEDAKRSWIASAISDNDFIPEPKIAEDYPDNFKLRLPKTLYKQLSVNANAEGVSMNQYCLYLLANGVKTKNAPV